MLDSVIVNGRLVLPERIVEQAVGVRDGRIAGLYPPGAHPPAAELLDAGGCLVFPGFIDCHTHMNEPGFTHREDFAHGTAAAARGGITAIVDMPMNNIPATATPETFVAKRELLQGKGHTDYALWGGLVNYNLDCLGRLHELGAAAFKSFLCKTGDDYTHLTLAEADRALEILGGFDGLAGFHCEDYAKTEQLTELLAQENDTREGYLLSRPLEAELEALRNILTLAEKRRAKIHICHVSHPAAAEEIRRAKGRGVAVTAETCVHYLIFTREDYLEKGALWKCSPPLREPEAAERLWEYIADGTLDCICSDHSPAGTAEKSEEAYGFVRVWNGISGVQTTAQALFHHAVHRRGLSPCLLACAFSRRPAQIFGLYGRKGEIAPGFDADFTILDPERPWTVTPESLLTLHKISAFVGQSGRGLPVTTILRGKVSCREGFVTGANGKFLARR